jgi:hypothetical protein
MAALRRRKIVEMFLQVILGSRRSRSLAVGPGCTCESCVQAWDRHHPKKQARREPRRLRPGLD